MRRRRYVTCKHFEKGNEGDIPAEAWEVLDSFDNLGIYVNKGIVDKELAWTTFYYWLSIYWCLLKDHVRDLQEYSDGVHYLKNIEDMYTLLTAYGVKHRNLPIEKKRCNKSKINDFIVDELKATRDPEWE